MDFTARGRTLEELFQEAALAASGLLVDPATVSSGGLRDRWSAEGDDLASLLARWLKETVSRIAVDGTVPARVTVRRLDVPERGRCVVEAEVDGELLDPARHRVLRKLDALPVLRASCRRTVDGWESRGGFDA